MKHRSRTLKKMLLQAFFLGVLAITAVFIVGYVYLEARLPDVETLKTVKLQVPLRIYTADGVLIGEYGEKRRIPVTLSEVPKPLIQAILATEDQRFYEHAGVDLFGLMRASVHLVKTGNISQGGSTITMQVARNFFLTRKKTFLRKINEILLAIKIDNCLSKEKILELYLNEIYFGNRAYGVAAAAQVYYGKNLDQLTLAQMAMIAGLPQAPSAINPLVNPVAAIKRRSHVLQRMLEQGYIDQKAYDDAMATPITARFHERTISQDALYVAEMVRQELVDQFGPTVYTNGYQIYTTIDSTLQRAANRALRENLLNYDDRHGYRGTEGKLRLAEYPRIYDLLRALKAMPVIHNRLPAVVISVRQRQMRVLLPSGNSIEIPTDYINWHPNAPHRGFERGDIIRVVRSTNDSAWHLSQIPAISGAVVALSPVNGAIKVLVGGFDFNVSHYNRATQAYRQPGSSIKPFIYAAALSKGFTLATVINDAPMVWDDPSLEQMWRPRNENHRFYGPTRLRFALVHSVNLVAIRLLQSTGIPFTVQFLTHFGFDEKTMPQTLSLALGTLSTTPLDLTRAYAVFANGGYLIDPYVIDHITDAEGKNIVTTTPKKACPHCHNSEDPDVSAETVPLEEQAKAVVSPQVAYLITSALQDVIKDGTGRGAQVLNRGDIAGKTGTTNNHVDAWFAGYNSDLVATVWVGFDQPESIGEFAAHSALPVWIDFMRVALSGLPEHSLAEPPGLVHARIDPKTGFLANESQEDAILEIFQKDQVPTQIATQTSENPTAESSESHWLEQIF